MTGTESASSPSRRVFLSGSVALAALVAAGCSKATDSTSGSGSRGSSVTVGIPSDVVPSNLLRSIAVNFPVHALVFDTLVALDDQSRQVVPRVAQSWSWNADSTVLTMTLRSDVKFHTGRALGPQDVLFAIKKIQEPSIGAQIKPVADYITNAAQTGPHEVTFTLKSPLSDFLDMFLMLPLIDEKTYSGLASGTKVVGTGPFTWDSWTPGTQLQLSRNSHYWQAGEPFLDAVTLKVYRQSQALLAALQSAEIDMSYMMLPRDAATFAHKPGYTTITTSPTFSDWYLGINVSAKPFTDVRSARPSPGRLTASGSPARCSPASGSRHASRPCPASRDWAKPTPATTPTTRPRHGNCSARRATRAPPSPSWRTAPCRPSQPS